MSCRWRQSVGDRNDKPDSEEASEGDAADESDGDGGSARRSSSKKRKVQNSKGKKMKNAYVGTGASKIAKDVWKVYRAGGLSYQQLPINDYDRRLTDPSITEDPLFHLTPLGEKLLQDIAGAYTAHKGFYEALTSNVPELTGADYQKYTPQSKERRLYKEFQLEKCRSLTANSNCQAHSKDWDGIDKIRQARFKGELMLHFCVFLLV